MRTMLPPFPKRSICCPAACAVNSTPFTLTSRTCNTLNISLKVNDTRTAASYCAPLQTLRNSSAGYWRQSMFDLRIPAAATHASIRPSLSPICLPIFHMSSYKGSSHPSETPFYRTSVGHLTWLVTSPEIYSNRPSPPVFPLLPSFLAYSCVACHSADGSLGRSTQ